MLELCLFLDWTDIFKPVPKGIAGFSLSSMACTFFPGLILCAKIAAFFDGYVPEEVSTSLMHMTGPN